MNDSPVDSIEAASTTAQPHITRKSKEWAGKFRELPDNLRLAALGAWRGRERGMAETCEECGAP